MLSYQSLRAFTATFLLALYFPVPLYMLWIHSLDRVWKTLGPASYAIHWTLYAASVISVVLCHSVWEWKAWAWSAWISWAGLIPVAVAAWLAYRTYATIPAKTLLTFRQLGPVGERPLVRDGILGTIRHPRYVMFTLLALGNVLITGFPLVLVSLAVVVAAFGAVVRLEEKELREHFGEAFEKYRRDVPAFFPRIPFVTKRRGRTS
jgi:protein-S-isoprenylcysteine O-methyltransferase Ste14